MRERLPRSIVRAIDERQILGIRAGRRSTHRFIGVWPVVVDGRVLARSWTLKPNGWYQTFLTDPYGTIQVGARTIAVRAVRIRSERIRDAVEAAYAVKYPTPGSRKYVRGFRTARRREATMEFEPRGQTGVRRGSDQGQTGVRRGSDGGQTRVRPESDAGQTFKPRTLLRLPLGRRVTTGTFCGCQTFVKDVD
jgi:hypothetical protein